MPAPALKHLAKKADVSLTRAEHLWHKAKDIAAKDLDPGSPEYYALVMGIAKKMLGLSEQLTEETQPAGMENVIRNLFMAQRCAHVHHWKVRSLSLHLALGELYDGLISFADELMEMYMGAYSADEIHISQSDPNHFSEQDPIEFIGQLHSVLAGLAGSIPQDGFLVNKYQELQGMVAKIKYKMERLS